jgi:hypothetical protein
VDGQRIDADVNGQRSGSIWAGDSDVDSQRSDSDVDSLAGSTFLELRCPAPPATQTSWRLDRRLSSRVERPITVPPSSSIVQPGSVIRPRSARWCDPLLEHCSAAVLEQRQGVVLQGGQ